MTPARISVIVPSYNRASFLPTCVESLRSSGVEGLELIIVDDGSTDDTRAVVESLQPGIRYVYQPNQGLPAARNTGIRVSTGRYLAYLDSDDRWLPEVPGRMLAALDRHPEVGLLFADGLFGNDETGYRSWFEVVDPGDFRTLPGTEPEPRLKLPDMTALYRLMLVRNVMFVGTVMVRRELVLAHGMFDEALRAGGEDWETWLRLARHTQFGYWTEPAAVYFKHPGAMTTDRTRMLRAWCEAIATHCRVIPTVPPAEERIRQRTLRELRFSRAYHAFDQGDLVAARGLFREAVRAGNWDPYTLALTAACHLPAWLTQRLRRLKQRLA